MLLIDVTDCWIIEDTIKDQAAFFAALGELASEGTFLYFEACKAAKMEDALREIPEVPAMLFRAISQAAHGLVGSGPNSNDAVFCFELSQSAVEILVDSDNNRDLYVNHVLVFNSGEILLYFLDAFMKNSPIIISRSVNSGSLEKFCRGLGVTCARTTMSSPPEPLV